MHKHTAIQVTDKPYTGPVSIARENPSAHGNICRREICICGAVRLVNINGNHREVGKWYA